MSWTIIIQHLGILCVIFQGDVVRKLKSAKAEKAAIDAEVKKLLALKQQLAAASGQSATTPDSSKGKKKKGGKK